MEISNKNKANYSLIALAVIALVILILFLSGCGGSTQEPTTIITKEAKGKFEAVKPEQTAILTENGKNIPKTAKSDIFRQNTSKSNEEFLQNQIDELLSENGKLQKAYSSASDSIKSQMYNKAITLNSFTHTWENDTIKATTNGIVRGEIQSIDLKYTIKSQKIEAQKPKETFLRVLGGSSFGINKELNQFTYSVSAGFQNKKGNIIRGQYQKIGNSEFFTAGYEFSILNWKR